jgi:hypothetical protein
MQIAELGLMSELAEAMITCTFLRQNLTNTYSKRLQGNLLVLAMEKLAGDD